MRIYRPSAEIFWQNARLRKHWLASKRSPAPCPNIGSGWRINPATRLDRFDLTTAFLAYAKDRLFGTIPDAAEREAELGTRFWAELQDHAEMHSDEAREDEDRE